MYLVASIYWIRLTVICRAIAGGGGGGGDCLNDPDHLHVHIQYSSYTVASFTMLEEQQARLQFVPTEVWSGSFPLDIGLCFC